jgi:hypothetical protein
MKARKHQVVQWKDTIEMRKIANGFTVKFKDRDELVSKDIEVGLCKKGGSTVVNYALSRRIKDGLNVVELSPNKLLLA